MRGTRPDEGDARRAAPSARRSPATGPGDDGSGTASATRAMVQRSRGGSPARAVIGPSTTRAAALSIEAATLAVLVYGLRRRNPNAVANAALAFAASFLPDVAETLFDVEFRPWQQVYAEGAMLAHAVGFLGPCEHTWWWDHLTHVSSATLVGGFVHVATARRGREPGPAVLAAVVVGGVLWEAVEYAIHRTSDRAGVDPFLVYYGPRDTIVDLGFDLVGALLVIAFGDHFLRNFAGDGS